MAISVAGILFLAKISLPAASPPGCSYSIAMKKRQLLWIELCRVLCPYHQAAGISQSYRTVRSYPGHQRDHKDVMMTTISKLAESRLSLKLTGSVARSSRVHCAPWLKMRVTPPAVAPRRPRAASPRAARFGARTFMNSISRTVGRGPWILPRIMGNLGSEL